MEEKKITGLLVTDQAGRLEGVVHIHDLWTLNSLKSWRGRCS